MPKYIIQYNIRTEAIYVDENFEHCTLNKAIRVKVLSMRYHSLYFASRYLGSG